MLGEYLEQHPLIDMLVSHVTCPFPAANDRTAWESLPQQTRESLLAMAAEYRKIDYPVLKATQFLAFVRDGSRKAWENPYFLRRKKLIAAAVGCCVSGTDEDLDEVIDGLWLICEESSWVLSAHNGSQHRGTRPAKERPLPDVQNPYIDLFAGQTAMILSLVVSMLGDRLDKVAPVIRRRVLLELDKRIIVPFMTRDDFWWMGMIRTDMNNWTPWIVSDVMLTAAMCVQDRLSLAELLTRAARMLDAYINVMPEDGGCDEGAAYWNMAGGALLDALELLWHVTDGKLSFFWQNEKIRGILSYPAKARLENGWFVNFADCDARPWISGERLQFAGEMIGDEQLAALGEALRRSPTYQISDTAQMRRLLAETFHPHAVVSAIAQAKRDVWLPDLQLRVVENSGMILAAKGGHNGENHNHNDVGSFMLYVDGEPEIIDVGNMVYTAKTFSEERYTLWNTRSMNHNVPLIGGREQVEGIEHAARQVQRTADGIQLDMAAAYPADGAPAAAVRSLTLTDAGLALIDTIELRSAEAVTWVFMLRNEPQVSAGQVHAGAVIINCDPDLTCEVTAIPVEDARMAANFPGTVYRLAFTAAPASCHDRTFTVAKA